MSPFLDCTFHVELNAFALQHVLKKRVEKLFALIRLYPDRPPSYGFRVFWVFKNQVNR